MSLTPFSRETMRDFKAQKDKECHQRAIETVVKEIYVEAVRFAEQKSETTYGYRLYNGTGRHVNVPSNISTYAPLNFQINKDYIIQHLDEILTGLRTLFPDCCVEYKKVSMARGRDGKDYDISNLDDKLRPFIDTRNAQINEYIIIDWS